MIASREVLCTGKVSSTRSHVNVMPSIGILNSHHPRSGNQSMRIHDYLKACIEMTIVRDVTPKWVSRIHTVTLREIERGFYGFTVWGDIHVCEVSGPYGTHRFTTMEQAYSYIDSKCLGYHARQADFSITMLETS